MIFQGIVIVLLGYIAGTITVIALIVTGILQIK